MERSFKVGGGGGGGDGRSGGCSVILAVRPPHPSVRPTDRNECANFNANEIHYAITLFLASCDFGRGEGREAFNERNERRALLPLPLGVGGGKRKREQMHHMTETELGR